MTHALTTTPCSSKTGKTGSSHTVCYRKSLSPQVLNKPRTAKVGAISKAQNCKRGDSLGFVKLQLVAKYEKN